MLSSKQINKQRVACSNFCVLVQTIQLNSDFFICRTIDGVTYPGTIKEKEAAKKQYEKAVSRGETAGLVK